MNKIFEKLLKRITESVKPKPKKPTRKPVRKQRESEQPGDKCPICGLPVGKSKMEAHLRMVHNVWCESPKVFNSGGLMGAGRSFGDWLRGK